MRTILVGLLLLASPPIVTATELVYEGTWVTTNRRLDGSMTCVATPLGGDRWRGNFYGVWQGRPFSYQVEFRGPPENLHGEAVIDGAHYQWTGEMREGQRGWFKGTFGGDRYFGSFNLKQKAR